MELCAESCLADNHCKGFTYDLQGKGCHRKSQITNYIYDLTRVSGLSCPIEEMSDKPSKIVMKPSDGSYPGNFIRFLMHFYDLFGICFLLL